MVRYNQDRLCDFIVAFNRQAPLLRLFFECMTSNKDGAKRNDRLEIIPDMHRSYLH
jgi:hypothetical protein